jgi:hypothetical protein
MLCYFDFIGLIQMNYFCKWPEESTSPMVQNHAMTFDANISAHVGKAPKAHWDFGFTARLAFANNKDPIIRGLLLKRH